MGRRSLSPRRVATVDLPMRFIRGDSTSVEVEQPVGDGVTVVALSPVCGGPFFGEVLAGVARELARLGGHLVVVQTLDTGRGRDELFASPTAVPIGRADADGAISITNSVPCADLELLRHRGTPVVLVSDAVDGFASATPDNVDGIRSAVAHLVEHGHTRIAFVGNLVQPDLRERHAAFGSAMEELGLAGQAQLFFPATDNGEAGGRDAGAAIVAAGVPLTAVVAGTDRNALGVLDALSAAGVPRPR